MPGPPEFVTMATLSPFGIGQLAKTLAVAKRFLRENSRMTPDWRRSASAARSAPARLPVWEDAAEVYGILDGLHVEKDLPDVFVSLPVFKRGLGVHVGLVADRNELREAEVEVAENVEDAPTERTGLGDEADVAALGQRFGKAGVHAHGGMRVDDAETVRPHAAHAVAADAFEKLGLEPGAFSPRFLEACGDHAQALDALFVALVDRLKHEACVHDDDGKVHFAGNVEHRRIGG